MRRLVSGDAECNCRKRDFPVAGVHIAKWRGRSPSTLAEIARRNEWESAGERTESVVRTLYLRLPEGTQLWERPGLFIPAEPALLKRAFGSAG